MSKQKLRDDHECQNCGHAVEKNYCPNCGQKNTETRQSFWHLFTHFIEDLTHYDGAFWKTIKYLLFRPAKLTKEYLEGKRMAYVLPVKLYIFISFVTFFVPVILPDAEHTSDTNNAKQITEVKRIPSLDRKESIYPSNISLSPIGIENPLTYTSIRQMDSIENLKPDSLKLSSYEYKIAKKLIKLYQHNTPEQVGEKFDTSFSHNIPKAVFIYMPLFAFVLWLFHGKKRWYFFDHGIFTLHYFSFLLLILTIIVILFTLPDYINNGWLNLIIIILILIGFIWMVYYFYRAHRKMYNESWIINWIKSSIMFIINMTLMLIVFVITAYITLYNLR